MMPGESGVATEISGESMTRCDFLGLCCPTLSCQSCRAKVQERRLERTGLGVVGMNPHRYCAPDPGGHCFRYKISRPAKSIHVLLPRTFKTC